jgi:hypothetical protein
MTSNPGQGTSPVRFPAGRLDAPGGLGALYGSLAHPILRLRRGQLTTCRARVAAKSRSTAASRSNATTTMTTAERPHR